MLDIIECVPTLSDTIKSKVAYIQGKVNDHYLDILLDLGAYCSVMRDEYVIPTNLDPPQAVRLTNADGREIATLGTTTANGEPWQSGDKPQVYCC